MKNSAELIVKMREMDVHEQLEESHFTILRVPGGWIYTIIISDNPSSVFVPYSPS